MAVNRTDEKKYFFLCGRKQTVPRKQSVNMLESRKAYREKSVEKRKRVLLFGQEVEEE